MDLYNEDDPNDDSNTRAKKRWRREQIATMFRLNETLNIVGIAANLNVRSDFDRAANNDSVSVLAKLINSVNPQGANPAHVIFDNHFKVLLLPKTDQHPEILTVDDMDLDYNASNGTEAERAVLEKVKCAMILAYTAKALGWESVNFGNTTDPLSRYCLKMACSEMGLTSPNETANVEDVPNITIKGTKMADLAATIYKDMIENPEKPVARGKHAGAANSNERTEPPKAAVNDDSGFDF